MSGGPVLKQSVHSGTISFYKSVLENAFGFLNPRTVHFTVFIFMCLVEKSNGTRI